MHFWAPSRSRKVWQFHGRAISSSFQSSKTKVNKHFKIRRQFQNSTACPNDIIQALVLNHFLFFKERYCPDPEEPHPNGGKFDWDSELKDVTPYDTYVTYTCDVGRQFQNSSMSNFTSIYEAIYPTQVKHCEWNQTWSPYNNVSFGFLRIYFIAATAEVNIEKSRGEVSLMEQDKIENVS